MHTEDARFPQSPCSCLDVYGDYISEDDGAVVNTLPEPLAAAKPFEAAANAVSLFG